LRNIRSRAANPAPVAMIALISPDMVGFCQFATAASSRVAHPVSHNHRRPAGSPRKECGISPANAAHPRRE
jgi:hypothetical protein